MGLAANAFTSYHSVGNREDLIDVITNISPTDTWVLSNTGTSRAENIKHEWQTDALATAASNAVLEGDDLSSNAITPTSRLQNSCQILRKSFTVTDTQEALDKAGRASEIDYQTMKISKDMARDIEYALVINSAEVTGTTAAARQLKGILGWIATNVTTATASTEDLTETKFNDNLALIWAQGGKPSNTLVGAYQKRRIDSFTTNTRNIMAEDQKLVAAVNLYQSSFGVVAIRLHTILNSASTTTIINLGDPELWRKAWLRPVKTIEIPRAGSARKFMMEAELTLESRQEKGSGKMTGYKGA
jgi:hypothetical protein